MQNYLNQQKQKQKNKDKIENIELTCWILAFIFFALSFLSLALFFNCKELAIFSIVSFAINSILFLFSATAGAIFYNKSLYL